MTASSFASLGPSMFGTVTRARQALVAARAEVERLEALCSCDRRCKCSLRPALVAAENEENRCAADREEREKAWAEYSAIRWS